MSELDDSDSPRSPLSSAPTEASPAPEDPSASPRPPRGGWEPPTAEALQVDFPGYEIRRVIGRGGMGAVYQAWQKSLLRLVAIKILPPALGDHAASFAARFQREAQAMARFSQPNIVPVYDAGQTTGGLLYFVMEYIEGADVQKLLTAQGAMPQERVLGIIAQLCDALAYAHKQGVIHRDIKPSNIMIDTEGRVKVADFGLAKVASDVPSALLTGTNQSMGTPAFMAPETMLGMGEVDQRADLYAVGVMLYQMLTGRLPRGRFDPPSKRVLGLDPQLDEIVDRAMQADPEDRYSSAIELRADLDRILAQRTPGASDGPPSNGGRPIVPRRGGEIKAQFKGCTFNAAIAFGVAVLAGSFLFFEKSHKSMTAMAPSAGRTPVQGAPVPAPAPPRDYADSTTPAPTTPAPSTGTSPRESPTRINANKVDINVTDQEKRTVIAAVLAHIDQMPGITHGNRDKLYQHVERARLVGKIFTIPFSAGSTAPRGSETEAIKSKLNTPEIARLLDDPTAVFVMLGYGDPKPDPSRSDRISSTRAETVLKVFREAFGLKNATYALGMEGAQLLNEEKLDKNRIVEIWVFAP